MRSASYQPASGWERGSFGRRATAFMLALAVHVLLLLMLFALAPPQTPPRPVQPGSTVFRLLPLAEAGASQPASKATKVERVKRAASGRPPPPKPPVPPVPPPDAALKMIQVTRDVFAAGDISALPSHPAETATAGRDAGGSGAGRNNAEGAGEGPGGAPLYNADWYVKPTHAEMAFYLPANGPQRGWGLIACRTIANFHVDDCQELGESPSGSGLARAVRQAAWQFRVLPPRIGGRALVGAWVRIRFDFTEKEEN